MDTGDRKTEVEPSASRFNFSETLSSLQYPNFRRLWLGQMGNSGAQWMEIVARGWLVYQLTDSPLMLGLVFAVRAAPMLFFGIFGGVLADRLDRRKLLVASLLANMVLVLILATLIVTETLQVWHVFATALLTGVVMAFQQPARQAMIPNLVSKRHLMNAIALNQAAMNVTWSAGPALAGFLVGIVGMGGTYYAQAVLLLWASVLSFSVKIPPSTSPPRKSTMFFDLKEGLAYVRSNGTILALLVLALVPVMLANPYQSMMPVFAKDVLNMGPEGLGILMSAPGIGAFVGSTLIASLSGFRRKGLLLLVGVGLFGLTLVAFTLSHWMVISVLILVAVGTAQSGFQAINTTLLQTNTPDELRGRVFSIFLLDRGLGPLGTTLAGFLTTFIGAPITIGLMGGACFLLALGIAIAKPSLRRLS
ncbi:MAG: MFS transporter [Dehalococcoidia bacterium]|nr:MFS transporter [Dehalococcoidia bacterium]